MLLDGLFVPLLAPFYRDGALYARKLEHNVDRLSRTPAAGLVAFLPVGEGRALTDAETREAMHAIAQLAAPDKVLLAELPRDSVRAALELARTADEASFDAVVVAAPADWHALERPRGEFSRQMATWFAAIADASPLPVVLRSGGAMGVLPLEMTAELAHHPNVIGIIEEALTVDRLEHLVQSTQGVSREAVVTNVFAAVTRRMLAVRPVAAPQALVQLTTDAASVADAPMAAAAPALKKRTKKTGFQVVAAGAMPMLPLLTAGARAVMPWLAAPAPQSCHEVLAAFRDGNPALTAEKEARLAEAQAVVVDELGVAALKYAADVNGYYGGLPRLPLLGLDAAGKSRVDEAMRELRN